MVKVVKLHSCDGEYFEVDQDVVSMCTTVKNMLRGKSAFRNSLGGQFSIDGSYVILKKEGRILASLTKNDEEEAVVSLPEVRANTLEKVIEYCKYHTSTTESDREKKIWDSEFVQVKQNVLCELASASYYLDIKPLVNLTSRAIATQISGKTSEEIRETFHNINYEAYAPVFANSLATRCRLQRKITKKKQQEKELKSSSASESDNRSVEELLSFINDETEGNKKKKQKKKKKKSKEGSKDLDAENTESIVASLESSNPISFSITPNSSSPPISSSPPNMDDYDDEDASEYWNDIVTEQQEQQEDDLDPEMQAALDREVEEFRQRLESMNTEKKDTPKIQLNISASSLVSSLVGVH